MENEYENTKYPFSNPKAVYLRCDSVEEWLKNKNVIIFHTIYTREMKVLIFYKHLQEVDL